MFSQGGTLHPRYHPLCDLSRMRMSKTVTFNVISASFILKGTLLFFFPNSPPKLSLPVWVTLLDINAINGRTICQPTPSGSKHAQPPLRWPNTAEMPDSSRHLQRFPEKNAFPLSRLPSTPQNSTPENQFHVHWRNGSKIGMFPECLVCSRLGTLLSGRTG